MNKKIFLLFLGLLMLVFSGQVYSQQTATTDVVYLKNGRMVRGRLLKIKGTNKLKLRSKNGAVYNLRFAEIEKLEKVEANLENLSALQTEPARKIRFTNLTGLAYAGGKGKQQINDKELKSDQWQSLARMYTINGVQLGQQFTVGFGTGLDFYMNGEYIAAPLFLDVRGTTRSAGAIKPEGLLSAGYSFGFNKHNDTDKGLFLSGGLGAKIKSYHNTALHLSLNYRFQQFAATEDAYSENLSIPQGQPGRYIHQIVDVKTSYNQFEVRVSHSF